MIPEYNDNDLRNYNFFYTFGGKPRKNGRPVQYAVMSWHGRQTELASLKQSALRWGWQHASFKSWELNDVYLLPLGLLAEDALAAEKAMKNLRDRQVAAQMTKP